MLNVRNIVIIFLLMVGCDSAVAQAPRLTGLVQAWYVQMMDNNLRHSGSVQGPYALRGEFRENGFVIRRTEIKAIGTIGDSIEWEAKVDPSISSGNSANSILQDVSIKYKFPVRIELKVGQQKNQQTLEGLIGPADFLLIERSQLARVFGETLDRGAVASVGFGSADAFGGRFYLGMFNGNVKQNDTNAQKDIVARIEMNYGKNHTFGAYTLQGSTNRADIGELAAGIFYPYSPDNPQPEKLTKDALDNKDKTDQTGGFYRFQTSRYHVSAEVIVGTIGRLYPSLVSGSGNVNSNRYHLDQKFFGYYGTLGYTFGRHSLIARYDHMNYNSGDEWYSPQSPYTRANGDYAPTYTEITAGYTYALNPVRIRDANIKVNYINRSANFLAPRAGQVGEQGGDTLYVCFQVGF
ncbi:MAG: OprO/OprP family phosphate-selective porin [Holophagaceae bacterium]|nr:OprO/OprP family phosphate-selective porin [Holophagaceae bacterium]